MRVCRNDLFDGKATLLKTSLNRLTRVWTLDWLRDRPNELAEHPSRECNRSQTGKYVLPDFLRDAFLDRQVDVNQDDVVPLSPEDPANLLCSLPIIEEVFHHADTRDQIEILVGERETLGECHAEFGLCAPASHVQGFCRKVHGEPFLGASLGKQKSFSASHFENATVREFPQDIGEKKL